MKQFVMGTILSGVISLLLLSVSAAEDAFERELVVKDQTRVMKVESVFKKLLQAYEDESPNDFLELVSDERFRQDYITFTDALYSDFRKYEIKDVTYWIDRVTSDHVKQFLYVKWEKRYINLDDGRPGTTTGFSRFLFDEVNGKYLLVELAGNTLFGGSLKEWRDETPKISGEVKQIVSAPDTATCGPENRSACDDRLSCENTGFGHWYDNRCNDTPQGQPDLFFGHASLGPANGSITIERFSYTIANRGTAVSGPCVLEINYIEMTGAPRTAVINTIGTIEPGDEYSGYYDLVDAGLEIVRIVPDTSVRESDESNNEWIPTPF